MKKLLVICHIAACAALLGGSASAGPAEVPPKPPAGQRPWAEGVSQEDQDKAIELFTEGTRLLKDAFFTKAVDMYTQALAKWNHPAIHFNLAKALLNLEKPVEAYEHLDATLVYGGAPLDDDQIEQVKRYRQDLYDTELAELVITATEPGAVVSLNGAVIFRAPGRWQGVVKPANVVVLGTKEGFQTAQVKPKLTGGQKLEIPLEILPIESSVKYVRPFSNAIPWTVIGGGVALLAGGAIANWQASESYAEYDKMVDTCTTETAQPIVDDNGNTVGQTLGCIPTQDIKDKKSTGELMETLSLVGYFTGGAVLATGVVLLIVNRERPVTVEGTVTPVSVLPYVGPSGAGVTATVEF